MNSLKILLLGQSDNGDIPTAPAKVAMRVYNELCKCGVDAKFVEYFLDGKKYGLFKKIFGSEMLADDPHNNFYRLGAVRFIHFLMKFKPEIIHILNYDRFPLLSFLLRPFLKYKII